MKGEMNQLLTKYSKMITEAIGVNTGIGIKVESLPNSQGNRTNDRTDITICEIDEIGKWDERITINKTELLKIIDSLKGKTNLK